jgi:hypothetical protein
MTAAPFGARLRRLPIAGIVAPEPPATLDPARRHGCTPVTPISTCGRTIIPTSHWLAHNKFLACVHKLLRASALFAAAVVLLTATTAQAEPITKLHSSGWWNVFYVASSSDKNPMCVMVKAVLPDEAKGGVLVKWTEDSGTAFQVWKPNWRMPEGSMVPVLLTFIYSDRSPLPTTADAKVFRPNLISSTIDKDAVVSFLKGFGDAKKMTINFPQSNEPQWTVAMDGSRNAVGAFVRCIARIRNTAPRRPLLPHQKAQGPDQAPMATGLTRASARDGTKRMPCYLPAVEQSRLEGKHVSEYP